MECSDVLVPAIWETFGGAVEAEILGARGSMSNQ